MMPILLTALLCSFFTVFYAYLRFTHPPYDLNTMATAVDRAVLCILSTGGADKSLARPGGKQVSPVKSVRDRGMD